jgi:hypothetical protein
MAKMTQSDNNKKMPNAILVLGIFFITLQPLLLLAKSNYGLMQDSLISKNFFSLQITPYFTSKVKFEHKGVELVQSKHLLSGEIGLGYYREFNNGWNLHSTLNLGLMPFNYNFEFDAPEGSIFKTEPWNKYYQKLDFNWSEYNIIQSYANFDILFSKNVYQFKNRNELEIGLGLRTFRYFIDYSQQEYGSSYGVSEDPNLFVRLFDSDINDTISNRYKLALILEASYSKSFKNRQQIKASLFFNYSPFNNIEGYYWFSNLGFLSAGPFSQKLTYLGFRFSYLIPPKRVRVKPD